MALTLDLPKSLEAELHQEAKAVGLSLPEYALRLLFARPPIKTLPQNGRELVAYWQTAGVIGTRPEITDSQHTFSGGGAADPGLPGAVFREARSA
jgi:hypothetical protein